MTLTVGQIIAIAPRVLPFKPCACGGLEHKIEPELVAGHVEVKCTACGRCINRVAAAVLGLATSDGALN